MMDWVNVMDYMQLVYQIGKLKEERDRIDGDILHYQKELDWINSLQPSDLIVKVKKGKIGVSERSEYSYRSHTTKYITQYSVKLVTREGDRIILSKTEKGGEQRSNVKDFLEGIVNKYPGIEVTGDSL